MRHSILVLIAGLFACVPKESVHSTPDISKLPSYDRIVIDSSFQNAYQVKSADINGDKRPDLVAVSNNLSEIIWYENPHWEKHILLKETTGNIDLNPFDVDGDNDIDLAIACEFSLRETTKGGHVYWLENPGVANKQWKKHLIDSMPTSHRIRWMDFNGDGIAELVNLPMLGMSATGPESEIPVKLVYYTVPDDPRVDGWPITVIDTSLHLSHGISIVNWDDDPADEILTASSEGLTLFDFDKTAWAKQTLTSGHEGDRRVTNGAGEVAVGKLGSNNHRFLASVEPWHGNKVVYYTENESKQWERKVIDTTFVDGHAIVCFDLNNDGYDEILAGHRGETYNLYIYQYFPAQDKWERTALDKGGMSTAGIHVFDANMDSIPDIAASGSATGNVILYLGKL